MVRADAGLLARVVENVVANALRHTDGPVEVAGEADGARARIRVVDHGPGIPAERHHEVFEPFQRLGDRGTSRGSGLGLAVARGFVEAVGARIELDDTPGGGLTVVVSLAIAEGAAAPAPGAGT